MERKKSVVSKWWCRKSISRLPPYNYNFYSIAFACIWTNCSWTQRQDIGMKTLGPKVRYSFFFINIYINKKQQTNKDNTICCGIQFYRIHCEFALTKETKTRIQFSTARIGRCHSVEGNEHWSVCLLFESVCLNGCKRMKQSNQTMRFILRFIPQQIIKNAKRHENKRNRMNRSQNYHAFTWTALFE